MKDYYCHNSVDGYFCDGVLVKRGSSLTSSYKQPDGYCPKCGKYYCYLRNENIQRSGKSGKKNVAYQTLQMFYEEYPELNPEIHPELQNKEIIRKIEDGLKVKIKAEKELNFNSPPDSKKAEASTKDKAQTKGKTQNKVKSQNNKTQAKGKSQTKGKKLTKGNTQAKGKPKINEVLSVPQEEILVSSVETVHPVMMPVTVETISPVEMETVSEDVECSVIDQVFKPIKEVEVPEVIEDILEELNFETVYESGPMVNPVEDRIQNQWKEADIHGNTAERIQELLDEEARKLSRENFILSGVDFNAGNLSEEEILEEIREKSINYLGLQGRTYTESMLADILARREINEKAALEKENLLRSREAKVGLPYNFNSGYLTEGQKEEFKASGVLSEKLQNAIAPSPELLYQEVSKERLSTTLAKKLKNTYAVTKEGVQEYHDFWQSICSAICNKEYGVHSYWIAAGSDWYISEYAAEVMKTGFASGLSVTPVISLEQLRVVFDKSHGYWNDMEFLANSPRNIRDATERFALFNQAYKQIYEGTPAQYKPKQSVLPPYRFAWRNYTESDVVIVTLPAVGLVVGGISVLVELLNARALAGLSTVIVSLRSVSDLNELNASFIPELFQQAGMALVTKKDNASYLETLGVGKFLYFSIYGDSSARGGSAVQNKKNKIVKKQL